MKRALVRVISGVALLGLAILSVGCQDDVTVSKPPGLEGTYFGTYSFLSVTNDTDTTMARSYAVKVVLDRPTFVMIPTGLESVRVYCEISAEYVQESESLRISNAGIPFVGYTRNVCDESFGNGGVFHYTLGETSLVLVADETVSAAEGQSVRAIRRLSLTRSR
jgi:hypothetical protein